MSNCPVALKARSSLANDQELMLRAFVAVEQGDNALVHCPSSAHQDFENRISFAIGGDNGWDVNRFELGASRFEDDARDRSHSGALGGLRRGFALSICSSGSSATMGLTEYFCGCRTACRVGGMVIQNVEGGSGKWKWSILRGE